MTWNMQNYVIKTKEIKDKEKKTSRRERNSTFTPLSANATQNRYIHLQNRVVCNDVTSHQRDVLEYSLAAQTVEFN